MSGESIVSTDVDAAMVALGAPLARTRPVSFTHHYTLDDYVRRLESNQFSSTWGLDDASRTCAAAATREWAEREYGDLDVRRSEPVEIVWRVYEVA